MNKAPVSESDLQAYVDECLPRERHIEVEAWLAAHPQDAQRVQAYRRQNDTMRAMFDSVLEEPVPERLQAKTASSPRRTLMQVAAMVSAVGLGSVLGWSLRAELVPGVQVAQVTAPAPSLHLSPAATTNSGLARRAAVAHAVYSPDVRRPVEVGAEQEDQLVAWLSKRLGVSLKPPVLGALGYELIGGRLLPGSEGPVAQFMYHDASGKRLTLYVSHEIKDEQETAFQFAEEGPIGVFFWIDHGMGYAISAGADKGELARVALAVYEQLRAH